MSLESPRRLKHGDELGPILRAADATLSPERIANNGAKLKATLAAGVLARSIALWKIGVVLLLLIGAVIVQRQLSGDSEPSASSAPIVAAVTADAALVVEPPDAAIAFEVMPDAEPAVVHVPEAKRSPRPAPVVVDAGIDAAPPPPPPSELPEQIKLYEDARAAGSRREFNIGLDKLDELMRRFPTTPLRADAELTRAELFMQANRLDEAAAALEALAIDPSHRGRHGELLRTLGDVRRKQNNCTKATDAYTRARAAGLSAREKSRVDRGMERCSPAP